MSHNKRIIRYSEYGRLLNKLVKKIKKSKEIKEVNFIYTFMRGGLPIAVHLSHYLNKPVYSDESKIDFTTVPWKTALIVDDIADTGKTLDGFQMLFPTATLFYKPRSIIKPTFYVEETEDWIVYPWELLEEEPNR